MSIQLAIVPHAEYLQVTLSGSLELKDAMDAVTAILDAAWENRQPHLLVDWRAIEGIDEASIVDRFEGTRFMAEQIAQLKARGLTGIRIAQVTNIVRAEAEGFSETVAANRGVENAAVTSIAEALAWLGVEEGE